MGGLHAQERATGAEGGLDADDEDVAVDGLRDQVVGALAQRGGGRLVVVGAAEDEDGQVGVPAVAMDAPHERIALAVRHAQVEEHDVDGVAFERLKHGLAGGDDDSVVARLLQDRGDVALAHDVPVGDEDPRTAQVEDRSGLADRTGTRRDLAVGAPGHGLAVASAGCR